jgi:hypothetical protein
MRGRTLLYIAALCCVLTQATPHGHEDDSTPSESLDKIENSTQSHEAETVPSNGTPAVSDPAIAYIPPKPESHGNTHDDVNTDGGMDMDGMGHGDHHGSSPVEDGPIPPESMSYWLWPEHRGLLYTHIICMILAWGFILPVGNIPFIPPPSNL